MRLPYLTTEESQALVRDLDNIELSHLACGLLGALVGLQGTAMLTDADEDRITVETQLELVRPLLNRGDVNV